jgi:ornithine cyclodeaminase/alanine dehydrogenase-like protein (mu-crystallin family)
MEADPIWIARCDAVERAYVARGVGVAALASAARGDEGRAYACLGAVASRYLAVGSPRTIGVITTDPASVGPCLDAHAVWFKPREVRSYVATAATLATAARPPKLADALGSDIVCVLGPLLVTARDLRRGTHVNLLGHGAIDAELARLATVVDELTGPFTLGELAAGLKDGRQLDELTVFRAGDAGPARAALAG